MGNPFSLEGKNIVVTGASSGIGRSTAIECSKAGATILLIGRNEERLEQTYRSLSAGNHICKSVDLTIIEAIEPVMDEFIQKQGKINGLIHAAGIEMTVPLNMTKSDHYQQLFRINVIAAFELARILSKKKNCDPEKGSSLVFISSVRAFYGLEGATVYAASKGALSAGIKSMSLELAPRKIRVNAVVPAIIKTEMTDNLFSTVPDEVRLSVISVFIMAGTTALTLIFLGASSRDMLFIPALSAPYEASRKIII